jgi:hypothetical protein
VQTQGEAPVIGALYLQKWFIGATGSITNTDPFVTWKSTVGSWLLALGAPFT